MNKSHTNRSYPQTVSQLLRNFPPQMSRLNDVGVDDQIDFFASTLEHLCKYSHVIRLSQNTRTTNDSHLRQISVERIQAFVYNQSLAVVDCPSYQS